MTPSTTTTIMTMTLPLLMDSSSSLAAHGDHGRVIESLSGGRMSDANQYLYYFVEGVDK